MTRTVANGSEWCMLVVLCTLLQSEVSTSLPASPPWLNFACARHCSLSSSVRLRGGTGNQDTAVLGNATTLDSGISAINVSLVSSSACKADVAPGISRAKDTGVVDICGGGACLSKAAFRRTGARIHGRIRGALQRVMSYATPPNLMREYWAWRTRPANYWRALELEIAFILCPYMLPLLAMLPASSASSGARQTCLQDSTQLPAVPPQPPPDFLRGVVREVVLGCDQGKEGDKDWGGDAGAATAAGGGGSKQHGTRDEQSTGGVPGEPRGQGVGMLRNKGRWWRTGFVGVWIGCPRALLLLVLLEQEVAVWVWCLVGLACVDDLVTFALDMRLVLVHQASPALFLLLAGLVCRAIAGSAQLLSALGRHALDNQLLTSAARQLGLSHRLMRLRASVRGARDGTDGLEPAHAGSEDDGQNHNVEGASKQTDGNDVEGVSKQTDRSDVVPILAPRPWLHCIVDGVIYCDSKLMWRFACMPLAKVWLIISTLLSLTTE